MAHDEVSNAGVTGSLSLFYKTPDLVTELRHSLVQESFCFVEQVVVEDLLLPLALRWIQRRPEAVLPVLPDVLLASSPYGLELSRYIFLSMCRGSSSP